MTRDALTYRFPRTLVQAFGTDARSAVAIERHRRPLSARVADVLTAVALAAFILGGLLYGWGAL